MISGLKLAHFRTRFCLAPRWYGHFALDTQGAFLYDYSLKKQYLITCAISGRVEVLDPLAKDYFKNLRAIPDKVRSGEATER